MIHPYWLIAAIVLGIPTAWFYLAPFLGAY